MEQLFSEDSLKVILSLVAGGLIGMEREYRSKAAGFRTIILISIGSTLFTIISIKLGGTLSPDRVAANVITGIGFIGAGVVFKDGLSVTGLTTAASIWSTAALGMAIGVGAYWLAVVGFLSVIVVLALFEHVQAWIDEFHQKRHYKITYTRNSEQFLEIEIILKELDLKFIKKKEIKHDSETVCYYDVSGSQEKMKKFNCFLLDFTKVKSFDC
jgi:putative Mg2+ transporter-C (MgtC) family protein